MEIIVSHRHIVRVVAYMYYDKPGLSPVPVPGAEYGHMDTNKSIRETVCLDDEYLNGMSHTFRRLTKDDTFFCV